MIVTAILAKDEADRYLGRVIEDCWRFSDKILVLNDHSTDDTAGLARSLGAIVQDRTGDGPMWGREAPARKELWDWATEECGSGWAYYADADHIMVGDPRPLCSTWNVNAWCYHLLDCWDSEAQHRVDGFWAGYQQTRPWLFRPAFQPEGWVAEWSERGIHTGHAPRNFAYLAANAPESDYVMHLGWVSPQDRRDKFERYRSQWEQMTPVERAHVSSIMETACP